MQASGQLQCDNEHDNAIAADRDFDITTRREGGHYVSEVRCASSGKLLARGEGPARLEAEVIAMAKVEDMMTRGAAPRSLKGEAAQRTLCPTV